MKVTYTHKGWFFLCPVYLNPAQGEGMKVAARHLWLEWWFDVNETLFDLASWFSHHEEPFPFKVTGKLMKPVEMEHPE